MRRYENVHAAKSEVEVERAAALTAKQRQTRKECEERGRGGSRRGKQAVAFLSRLSRKSRSGDVQGTDCSGEGVLFSGANEPLPLVIISVMSLEHFGLSDFWPGLLLF